MQSGFVEHFLQYGPFRNDDPNYTMFLSWVESANQEVLLNIMAASYFAKQDLDKM